MKEILSDLIQTATERGVTGALERLGKFSGEISRNEARRTYGKWFAEQVANGRLRPVRVGTGKNGKLSFRVADIQNLKLEDLTRAFIQTS